MEYVAPQDIVLRRYVGLITRGIAFALDAAVINGVAVAISVGVALILSVFPLPHRQKTLFEVIGGVVYVLWWIAYFATFWSTTGQTLGARVMQFRVVTATGGNLKLGRALVRCVGLVLAALPLFTGYLLIPFDNERRGLQDLIAGTVVVEAPTVSAAERRRRQRADTRAAVRAAAVDGHSSDSGEATAELPRQADGSVWSATPAPTIDQSGSPG